MRILFKINIKIFPFERWNLSTNNMWIIHHLIIIYVYISFNYIFYGFQVQITLHKKMSVESAEQKVAKFESFINDVLKESLKQIFTALEVVNEELMELERLSTNIESMSQLADDAPAGKPLKTRVNVGCDFFMQANVDVSKFLVSVGLGCYVEFTKDEALAHIRQRVLRLKSHADELRDKGARVRAQITLALHCIGQMQAL